jgi:hypothetical protein
MRKLFLSIFIVAAFLTSFIIFQSCNIPAGSAGNREMSADSGTISVTVDSGMSSQSISVVEYKVIKVTLELTDPNGLVTTSVWRPGDNPVFMYPDKKPGTYTLAVTELDESAYAKKDSKLIKAQKGYNTHVYVTIGGNLIIEVDDGSTWSFGVMGDTQWTLSTDPAGKNPNGVSKSIIDKINKQFISKHVNFVIQVGDLTEDGNDTDISVRAAAAQSLYDAGIGFFPMRGNHETYANPANGFGIAAFRINFPQTQGISRTFDATSFNSPVSVSGDLLGMSYSFDYGLEGGNARFVIIDDWVTPSKEVVAAGYHYGYSVADQQAWISNRLDKNSRSTTHAFVFSHQNIMGENHQDSLFNGYTDANPDMQNAFFSSLQGNGAKYYISGHDHIHQRSIVASPDGLSKVEELITASCSSKFYTPKSLTDANWKGQKSRETSVAQEMYTVGFYIFTVDGPRVTVDYYADDHGNWKSDASYPNGTGQHDTGTTPTFTFEKKATWGYSTNGKEFLVGGAGGTSYTVVNDSFGNTEAHILSGTYGNTAADYNGRVLT